MRLAIALGALLAAQDSSPQILAREYARQLRNPDLRYRAAARLAHLGRPAIEVLERETPVPDALPTLREEVALHERLRDSYAAPRTFTFDAKEEQLGALLARLEEVGGITFYKNQVDVSARLSLSLRDAPFWEALDEICRKGSLLYTPSMADQLYLTNGILPDKPRNYYGSILVTLDRVILERRVLPGGSSTSLTARLACVWERRIAPRGLTKRYRLLRAEDDQGRSLLPAEPPDPEPVVRPLQMTTTTVETLDLRNLRPLPADARRIAALEGTFELEFPERIDTAAFASPLDSPTGSRALEGVAVELRNCYQSSSSGVIADFALAFRDEAEAAAYRVNSRDPVSEPPSAARQYTYIYNVRSEKNLVTFSVRFYAAGGGTEIKRLSLRVPRGSVIKHVPFSFRNVELK